MKMENLCLEPVDFCYKVTNQHNSEIATILQRWSIKKCKY